MKSERIIGSAIAMIRRGSDEEEVIDWLEQKNEFSPEQIESIIKHAHAEIRKEIRTHALIRIVCSLLGILIVAGFIIAQVFGGFVVVGWGSVLLLGIGVYSVFIFFKSLIRFTSGKQSEPLGTT